MVKHKFASIAIIATSLIAAQAGPVPNEANPKQKKLNGLEFRSLAFDNGGRPVWKPCGLSGEKFERISKEELADGTWGISIWLKPEGATILSALSRSSIPHIGIFVNGRPVALSPGEKSETYRGIKLKEPITGNAVQITGNYTRTQADALLTNLNAGLPK